MGTIAAQLADQRDHPAAVVLLVSPAVPIDGVRAGQAEGWSGRAGPHRGDGCVRAVLGGSDGNVPPPQVDACAPVVGDTDDHLEILPGITHALARLDEDDPGDRAG